MMTRQWVAPPGFTLLEILITLSVLGVLLASGLPYMRDFILDQKVKNAISDLHLSLIQARSEAVKRNANVDMVLLGGSWSNGWVVTTTISGTVVMLKSVGSYPDLTITGPTGVVTYQRNGRLASAVPSFSVRATNNTAVRMRCVAISANGSLSMQIDRDSNTGNGC